ncbi:hypothetical protein IQ269_25420 [Tychonema sp. LEGE 07199]|uniref:hypothetical protein n=1 Tax=unclassified Tychonema TaxID=2642144 RepID=UPI00187FB008|nr:MULTISPECIES: hypothetical protein [unclassified Tychonema]MBE9124050.1 hypothetical protein [Tychonema sp. LEGE 07199]MBE9134194.1 hypothetical protein [Tychonema sp. LEGE 07196]
MISHWELGEAKRRDWPAQGIGPRRALARAGNWSTVNSQQLTVNSQHDERSYAKIND